MNTLSDGSRHYLVGGGIASLAAAVVLVRDAGVRGGQITILEQLDRVGGSLDGSGTPRDGYLVRGGRMFEEHFVCTFDLLASIPSIDFPGSSVKDEIFAFNEAVRGSSRCRLVRGGQRIVDPGLGLGFAELVALNRLLLTPEALLGASTIDGFFDKPFFETNFWLMWSTMFSFQPWHSAAEMRRYLKRFIHLFPGFARIEGILRTRYNQYDSIIFPILEWLRAEGVQLRTNTAVSDVEIVAHGGGRRVASLQLGSGDHIIVRPEDRVYLTLGSMTEASACGSNTRAPKGDDGEGGAWALWTALASRYGGLGNPARFCGNPDKTGWVSFTATLDNPAFFDFMERFSGNRTGTGGLVTFAESGWLLSIVMFHHPHFRDQAPDRFVFWGYGLRGDRNGDLIKKPMRACSGEEMLAELAHQLRLGDAEKGWFQGAIVVPCRMPFITSQFMPRSAGDRPPVRPAGAENFAVVGQYCEMPDDTVFTVEYSVRSAMLAVHEMTGRTRPPPPVARGDRNPMVLLRAGRELLGL